MNLSSFHFSNDSDMKPRTKEQKEIVAISNRLKPLPEWRFTEARHKGAMIIKSKHDNWCSACGSVILQVDAGKKCPVCGSVIESTMEVHSSKRVLNDSYYYEIITTSGRFQIIRIFLAKRRVKKNSGVDFHMTEACRIFISDKGKKFAIARMRLYNGYYFDSWSFNSPMDLRRYDESYERLAGFIGSRVRLLPVVHRNGLDKIYENCSEIKQIINVLTKTKFETIAKYADKNLFTFCVNNEFSIMTFWPAIKQVIKHKIRFRSYEDVQLWFDYLLMLENLHKDWHNPSISLPQDITKAHDELVKKQEVISKKKADKERREQMIRDQKINEDYIQKFTSIMNTEVSASNIVLKILQNIEDFSEEAKALHHCVFEAAYYNIHIHPESVIIGAKVNGERTETIEINYKTRQIVQCQGRCNQNSEYHEEILNLLTKNIDKFIPKQYDL